MRFVLVLSCVVSVGMCQMGTIPPPTFAPDTEAPTGETEPATTTTTARPITTTTSTTAWPPTTTTGGTTPCPSGYHLSNGNSAEHYSSNALFVMSGGSMSWPEPDNPRCVPNSPIVCDLVKLLRREIEVCACFPYFTRVLERKSKLCACKLGRIGCALSQKKKGCTLASICPVFCA
uniref:Uncharacterized protein n=1 Tax=Plectus sambesii TaxID=2011161 RepID=A0A914UHM7_9BILA